MKWKYVLITLLLLLGTVSAGGDSLDIGPRCGEEPILVDYRFGTSGGCDFGPDGRAEVPVCWEDGWATMVYADIPC